MFVGIGGEPAVSGSSRRSIVLSPLLFLGIYCPNKPKKTLSSIISSRIVARTDRNVNLMALQCKALLNKSEMTLPSRDRQGVT
jgi:hypothetical protein